MSNPLTSYNTNTTGLLIESDQEINITRKSKYSKNIPYFTRLALTGGCMSKFPDARLFLISLSNVAKDTLLQMDIDKEPSTNIVEVAVGEMTIADKKRYQRGVSELITAGAIIRVKRGMYMINPAIFLPRNSSYDTVLQYWLSLGGEV